MKIRRESIHHFTAFLRERQHFALAGYSDAEWCCVLGLRAGDKTGLGQILCPGHGRLLLDVLRRRQGDPNFYLAVPGCLYPSREGDGLPGFSEGEIDWFLGRENVKIEAVERDRLTDDLARDAGLYPLIRQLQEMPTVLIGPAPLRKFAEVVLRCRGFVEIATPNLHREPGGIDRAVAEAKRLGGPAVFLVSAGVSAAVIVDRLYGRVLDSWFLDCGSIWDAFAGIGGQREWRAKLYADPDAHAQWIQDNLQGKNWEKRGGKPLPYQP